MKYLEANKVKDGWVVTITRTEHLQLKRDVMLSIRREGLKIKTRNKGKIITIFAD